MAKTGTRRSTKPYHHNIELERIIAAMGDAMRSAHLPYIADAKRMTLRMEDAWFSYVQFALKLKDEVQNEKV